MSHDDLITMESKECSSKKERIYPTLDLTLDQSMTVPSIHQQQPILEIQSPKTPTLSRKLKAVSLDSDPPKQSSSCLEVSRDVFSMPNTPKRQIKHKLSCDDFEDSESGPASYGGGPNNNYSLLYTASAGQNSKFGGGLLPNSLNCSNLKKFASNTSISGSQTLKTLPEIMTLQDFSTTTCAAENVRITNTTTGPTSVKIKTAKGLLERRGSNASLTIDLGGSNSNISEKTNAASVAAVAPSFVRLNTAKSVSNLNLSTFGTSATADRCICNLDGCSSTTTTVMSRTNSTKVGERRKSQEACNNCTIYESSVPPAAKISTSNSNFAKNSTKIRNPSPPSGKRCNSCLTVKCRRKSLSNENLYVPPPCCHFCHQTTYHKCHYHHHHGNGAQNTDNPNDCASSNSGHHGGTSAAVTRHHCTKGYRRACYPRQPDLEKGAGSVAVAVASHQLLSEDFKWHLQNVQYLQTAGSLLTIGDLKMACEVSRVPKLHSEFWEVPLNLQEKCYVSGSQSRNRYKGFLPNEHSRVHLPGPLNSYIHANYIKGPDYTETAYIATQGPMAHTCQDFWEMIWHNNCASIVMLTNLVEKGQSKCELYFPLGKKDLTAPKSFFRIKTVRERDKFVFDGGTLATSASGNHGNVANRIVTDEYDVMEFEELNECQYGAYKIRYLREEVLDECVIRRLELSKVTGDDSGSCDDSDNDSDSSRRRRRAVAHYWYPYWQDHKMANPEQLLKMALHLLDDNKRGGECTESGGSDDTNQHRPQPYQRKKSQDGSAVATTTTTTTTTNVTGTCLLSSSTTTTTATVKSSFLESSAPSTVVLSSSSSSKKTNSTCLRDTMTTAAVNKTITLSNSKQSTDARMTAVKTAAPLLLSLSSQQSVTAANSLTEAVKFSKAGRNHNTASAVVTVDAAAVKECHENDRSTPQDGAASLQNRASSMTGAVNKCHKKADSSEEQQQQSVLKKSQKKSPPIVVHCSAGIGRTGCFLAILNGIQQLRHSHTVDVLAILCSLRLNRGGMVQTAEQYELIHRVLSLYSQQSSGISEDEVGGGSSNSDL